jgi:N-acylneuraminate cytidylyltransferase|tara:strand:+ start:547 stop:1242 length:696 start_codon:yes stop_codon:yes gene_type:complete
MSTVAFIFARGGSKGLPGKNIKIFSGKPLIAWSIEQAKKLSSIDRVIVSTDCSEIARVAKEYGAEVPFLRPDNISEDDSPEWMAWRHALSFLLEKEGKMPNIMLSIPTTAPLRRVIDIENCLNLYKKGGVDVVITTTDAHRSPYFNMVKKSHDGNVELVIKPKDKLYRRQDAPIVYDMTTVAYVMNPEFIMHNESIFDGRTKAVNVPLETSIDIDNMYDFKMAEFFLDNRE